MLIYKEHLPKDTLDVRKVRLPFRSAEDARKAVLNIQLQHGSPCMWYQADYDSECYDNDEFREYLLMAIGTGHHWSDDEFTREQYIGTAALYDGSLMLHYFLVENTYSAILSESDAEM